MNELLKTLYWNLYTPYVNEESEQELDVCHKQLIEVLGKPERKLVLRIIDGKGIKYTGQTAARILPTPFPLG